MKKEFKCLLLGLVLSVSLIVGNTAVVFAETPPSSPREPELAITVVLKFVTSDGKVVKVSKISGEYAHDLGIAGIPSPSIEAKAWEGEVPKGYQIGYENQSSYPIEGYWPELQKDGSYKLPVYSILSEIDLTGFTWQQRKDSIAVGVGYKTVDKAPEFRFQSYNLQTKKWEVIGDWSTSNWIDWKAAVGDYWLHCEMRSADKLATTSKTMAFRYTAGDSKISGTYSGWRNGEVLLGATTVNQNTKIQFKIYNLDTQQWSYLTDENNRSNWVSWQAKKGNYWVHFESRTDDGRLADTNTYCFAVK